VSHQQLCQQGHENPRGARFCVTCGAALSAPASDTELTAPENPFAFGADQPAATSSLSESVGTSRSVIPKRWLGIGAAAVIGALVLGGLVFFVRTASVPDVTGQTAGQAKSALEDAGFVWTERQGEFSDEVREGAVIRQEPGAGSRTRSGNEVTLIVSLGPAVIVPDFVGENVSDAESQGDELSLTLEEQGVESEVVPAGEVIQQATDAGSEVAEGTVIGVTVSTGPPLVTITYVHDGLRSSTYTEASWDCDTYLSFWGIVYSEPVLQDESGRDLATGSWVDDSGNGPYFPCKTSVTFRDVTSGADEYRVAYSADDPEDNRSQWISKSELEASGWTFGG